MTEPHKTNDGEFNTIRDLEQHRVLKYAELNEICLKFKTWGIGAGRLRIRARASTNTIAIVFLLWHVLAATAGIVITVIWDSNKALGVALIVGALFGIGSFMAQFWSQAMNYQREFIEKVFAEDDITRLRATLDELAKIDGELKKQLENR